MLKLIFSIYLVCGSSVNQQRSNTAAFHLKFSRLELEGKLDCELHEAGIRRMLDLSEVGVFDLTVD